MTDSPGRPSWNASGAPAPARPQTGSKGTLWKQIQEASVKTFHQVRDALDEQPPPHGQPSAGTRGPQSAAGQPRPQSTQQPQSQPQSAPAAAAGPAQTLNSNDNGVERKGSTPSASPREKSINGDAVASATAPANKPKRRAVPSFKMPAELPSDVEALKELLQSANQYVQYVEEDRANMLTSISTMAQDMANIRMTSTDSSSQVTKMQQEIESLKKESAEKESSIQKLKERVKFAAVDQAQQELKKSKAECTALQEKLAACATKEKELNDTIEDYKREVAALEREKEVLRTAHIDAAKKAETLMRKEEECKELSVKLEQLTQEHQGLIVSHAEQIANLEKQAEIKMDEMEAQRRNYKVKAESIQRDLAKIVKIDAKYKAENQRLQEELQRKTKSLKDAIEALGTYMAKEDAHIEKSALRMAKDGVKVINKAVGSVGNAVVKTAKAAASLATNSPAPIAAKRPAGSPASSTASAPTGQGRGQPRRRPASGSPNGAEASDPFEDQLP